MPKRRRSKRAGISEATLARVVEVLERYGAMTLRDLGEVMGLKPAYLQRVVAILHTRRLVVRRRKYADSRGQPAYEYELRGQDE